MLRTNRRIERCDHCRERDRVLADEYLRHCPVCGRSARYVPDLDRYIHLDGSSHRFCWAAITSTTSTDYSELRAPMSDVLYPVTLVAAELNCGVRDLVSRSNGHLVRNEDGMRCLPGDYVKSLIDADREAREAQREDQRRRDAELMASSTTAQTRQRVRALARKQRALNLDTDVPLHESALATVTSEHTMARMDKAGQLFSDMKDGSLAYHPISERD